MTDTLSLYRIRYLIAYAIKVGLILDGIRPSENKIQRIVPGQTIEMDLILTEEELSFMKLSIVMTADWIQEWTHRDERR